MWFLVFCLLVSRVIATEPFALFYHSAIICLIVRFEREVEDPLADQAYFVIWSCCRINPFKPGVP